MSGQLFVFRMQMNRFIKIPSINDGEYSIVIGFTNAYWRYYAAQVALSQAVLWMGRWGIWNSTGKQLFLSLLWHPIHQELLKMFLVQMIISHTTGAYWKSPNSCTKAPGYTSVHSLLLEMAGKSFWRTLLLEERKKVHFSHQWKWYYYWQIYCWVLRKSRVSRCTETAAESQKKLQWCRNETFHSDCNRSSWGNVGKFFPRRLGLLMQFTTRQIHVTLLTPSVGRWLFWNRRNIKNSYSENSILA